MSDICGAIKFIGIKGLIIASSLGQDDPSTTTFVLDSEITHHEDADR